MFESTDFVKNEKDSSETTLKCCKEVSTLDLEEPILSDIFREAVFQDTGEYKGVKVDVRNMPVEIDTLLQFVGEKDFVESYVDKIIFTPTLEENGSSVNSSFAIEEGERVVYLNIIEKTVGSTAIWKDEIDMFDSLVYEAKHFEILESGVNGNLYSFEKMALEKQLQVLTKFANHYSGTSMQSRNTYLYFKNRTEEIKEKLRTLL